MDTIRILGDLVAFDTTSRLSNLPLLQYVTALLDRHGIEPRLIYNDDRTKANLWATVGPPGPGGIILSGHTDTVPVDNQDWTKDPFKLTEQEGLMYARGACDMKGFLASVLAALPEMVDADLKRPIHLAFSHDEELGCVGVRSLIEELRVDSPGAAFCIVGEPTEMTPVIGHKGGQSYKVRVEGREAHSSLAPHAVNAIEYAAELIVFLRKIAERMRDRACDDLYDVPRSTLSTGMISGGSAINIVPRQCEFVFEFRYLRGVEPAEVMNDIQHYVAATLEPAMQAVAPEARITFENNYAYPHFEIDPAAELVSLTKAWAGRNREAKVAYGTEAGYFSGTLGIPTIVCGPGSIIQAHKPDEYISRDQLDRCDRFLRKVIEFARVQGSP
ncbi:MAG: acetylornithine deacetylase [Hyphomicrobiales bacterium]